jgi:hypothetical protein
MVVLHLVQALLIHYGATIASQSTELLSLWWRAEGLALPARRIRPRVGLVHLARVGAREPGTAPGALMLARRRRCSSDSLPGWAW